MAIIRVIDFETTGLAPPEEVIEVGLCDIDSDTGAVACGVHGKPVAWLCGSARVTAETRAVHHIDPVELAGRPPWDAPGFVEVARGEDVRYFAAHHANFEAQWFVGSGEPPWICTYKCALRAWPDAPAHGNQVLRYWLEEQGRTAPEPALCQPAHRAGPDAYASAHLLAAILRTGATVAELLAWTKEPALLPRITIGPQRGTKWAEVEAGFLNWMIAQATMDADLKWNAKRELNRRAGR